MEVQDTGQRTDGQTDDGQLAVEYRALCSFV